MQHGQCRLVCTLLATLSLACAAPGAAQDCAGDCDGDGAVTVRDLTVALDIALNGDPANAPDRHVPLTRTFPDEDSLPEIIRPGGRSEHRIRLFAAPASGVVQLALDDGLPFGLYGRDAAWRASDV